MNDSKKFGEQSYHESEHPGQALSKDAMQYLYSLGQLSRDFTTIEIDGHVYTNADNLVHIKPVKPEVPMTLNIFTLRGFVDYIQCEIEKLNKTFGRLMVLVDSERQVSLYSSPYGPDNAMRALIARATVKGESFEFNKHMGQEDFIIGLQSLFVQTENSAKVGKVVGNLDAEQAVNTSDDGISQRAVVRTGIQRKENVVIENPVELEPYRTFVEVDQPSSPFALRIKNDADKKEPQVALYEADGGMWKVEAVHRIGKYIEKGLEGLIDEDKIIVIA